MSATAAEAPAVDCHAHVYTLDMPLDGAAWHRPPEDAGVERYLATLDRHGVQRAVLAAASLYGSYNDYAIEACRAHRARLRTTVIVEPDTDPYLLRRMRDDGVVGVRFQRRNVAEPPDLRASPYRRLLRRIADLGWHAQLHDEGARLPAAIDAILDSGARLVIDHFGRPTAGLGVDCPGFQAVLRAIDGGNTWVKLSAAFRVGGDGVAAALAQRLLAAAGPERLLWGSDWPFAAHEHGVRYEDTLATFERVVPDAAVRRRIGGETPQSLYFS